jgi:hypothetical protein
MKILNEKMPERTLGKIQVKKNTVDSRNSGSRFSGPLDLAVSIFGPKELQSTLDLTV